MGFPSFWRRSASSARSGGESAEVERVGVEGWKMEGEANVDSDGESGVCDGGGKRLEF